MKRKLAMGLMMALVLSLSACGSNEGTGSEVKESTTKTENSTGVDKEDADTDKENKKETQKQEVSLEALKTQAVSPAEDFEFMMDGMSDGLALCGYKGKDEMVVIPEEVDGKKVVSIVSKAFGEDSGVKAVKIPDSVERLSNAFCGNKELQYVIFGSGLKEIHEGSFQFCSSIERIELNEGVEEIMATAFNSMSNLKYLYIPESVVEIDSIAISAVHDDFVIAGKVGSKAEEHAIARNYAFEAVE